jgi:PKD repeat protein
MKKIIIAISFLILLSLALFGVQVNAQVSSPSPFYEYSPLTPRVGDTVTFNASRFIDYWKETTITRLVWDFADGTSTQTGTVITHTFTKSGSYWVGLTAYDSRGPGQTSALEVRVTEQTPITIYQALSTDEVYIGQNVLITGNLTYNGRGVPNETVSFYTKVYLDEAPWVPIGTAKTQSDGTYSYEWATVKSSGYQVKAEWPGNTTYPQTSVTNNLYVIPYGDFITGFHSNSTITGLSYNMTTRQLTFTAEGPDGSGGYVNVMLEKNSAFNPQTVTVLLDNNPLQFTVDSTEANWILSFTYTHSTHRILVDFTGAVDGQIPTPNVPIETTILIVAAGLAAVAALLGLQVYLDNRRNRNRAAVTHTCEFLKLFLSRNTLFFRRVNSHISD